MNTLNSQQLDALIHNGAIKSIAINGTAGGFVVTVNNGMIIEAQRGHARVFKKLQTAAMFLKNKGIEKVSVDLSSWSPDHNSTL